MITMIDNNMIREMRIIRIIIIAMMALSPFHSMAQSNAPYHVEEQGILGDVNSDGIINVTDVIQLVNYLVGNTTAGFNEEMADLNGDGDYTVTDVMLLVNIIVSNSQQPDPDDGTPPTDDDQANPDFPVLAPPNHSVSI